MLRLARCPPLQNMELVPLIPRSWHLEDRRHLLIPFACHIAGASHVQELRTATQVFDGVNWTLDEAISASASDKEFDVACPTTSSRRLDKFVDGPCSPSRCRIASRMVSRLRRDVDRHSGSEEPVDEFQTVSGERSNNDEWWRSNWSLLLDDVNKLRIFSLVAPSWQQPTSPFNPQRVQLEPNWQGRHWDIECVEGASMGRGIP